jgi:hypothetical protein
MKITRITAIVTLLFVAINALLAGYLFIADPSGSRLNISAALLHNSPFTTFLIPGIILFTVNGVFNLIAAMATILELKNYPRFIIWQGIILIGWIIIQIILLQNLNFLHFILSGIGVLLFMLGNRLDT